MKLNKLLHFTAIAIMIAPITLLETNYNKANASSNAITSNEIKKQTYYGKKAIGYYGFKHAGGFWKDNRNLKRYVVMNHNIFNNWQAGGGSTYKVKGKYVHFIQSDFANKRKNLVVKESSIAKYVNDHGGKNKLKSIKTIGTNKELSKMTY